MVSETQAQALIAVEVTFDGVDLYEDRSLRTLASYSDHPARCLYVGKGPSAVFAKDHLDFGHIATVNFAAVLFSEVDWSFWCDVPPVSEIEVVRDRCRTFIVPDVLHVGTGFRVGWRKRPLSEVGCFPVGRTLTYPYSFFYYRASAIRNAVEADQVPMSMTATAGLFILARYLGYREIWCFGHDGGDGHAAEFKDSRGPLLGNYDKWRRAMETLAECLREKFGTIVRFWPEADFASAESNGECSI